MPLTAGLPRAGHGTTNAVFVDRRRGLVVKRFSPAGTALLWRGLAREAAALRLAMPTGLVPRLVARDPATDPAILSIEYVEATPYPLMDHADPSRSAYRAGAALRRVHALVPDPASADHLRLPGDGPGARWSEVIAGLADQLCAAVRVAAPELADPVRDCARRLPRWCAGLDEPQRVLVHGDYGGANVLLRPDGQLSIVDWEWAHAGDPGYDLARLAWQDTIGRRHGVYRDERTGRAFRTGYGCSDSDLDEVRLRVYGTLMALGHCLAGRLTCRETGPFEQWLYRVTRAGRP